ncbi:MAG: fibronectin type III domain-containing protein [Marinobacter sp.]|uniref:fibronectin type III domain-containing protein n=1 Tax=Marinobacter sp. TaxID=50741 RepID=UPI0032979323
MEGTKINRRTAGKASLRTMLALGLLLLGLAGCQEDSGASRAASSQANEVSAKRLDNAISSFRDTLGQSGEDSPAPRALRWEAPLTREDGSRLYSDDISGYRIYYRLRHEKRFDVIRLPGGADAEYPLDSFPPGAYEFSITTIDDNGLESRRSDAIVVDLI